ncbi:helix-turn-helix domain-containing protein [Nakamurella sp. YIM 132087]|uniref:Helix-turn-helix domain-containing protein n=1 Tax=Nakamurella alba TaxID=2665158 RepID=A0A7K1FMA5_9ACTN|nr:helix-turn-helix domain-containing protein [Nakamurella alba]MTD15236.1 helix-turn-helix domain-containing protein [Nakamurella alba]
MGLDASAAPTATSAAPTATSTASATAATAAAASVTASTVSTASPAGRSAAPRTPAVHRAVTVLDAVWSDRARTPAALAGTLGLAKSSVADLLGTLESEGLLARAAEGRLQLGGRWAAFADPRGRVDRLLRSCSRFHDLDGHTLSVSGLVGTRSLCLDVRPGQLPLPLTPRPGQYTAAAGSAAAVSLLSALPEAEAARVVADFAAFEGTGASDREAILALRQERRRGTALQLKVGRSFQVACADAEGRLALTAHLPDRLDDPAELRRISRAVLAVVADLPDSGT